MTERELGKALLRFDLAGQPLTLDPRLITLNILRRDQRRVRWLVALIGALLIGATLGFTFVVHALIHLEDMKVQTVVGKTPLMPPWYALWVEEYSIAAIVAAGSIGALVLTFVATLMLIFASRRATLRQINTALIEISEQLRQLRQAAGT